METFIGVALSTAALGYASLAVSGRIYPFAPYTMVYDPDGGHNQMRYRPQCKAQVYMPKSYTRAGFCVDMKEFLERKAREKLHYKDNVPSRFNCCPIEVSVWPSAISYYQDYLTDSVHHTDRKCLYVVARYCGEKYVETVIKNTME